MLFYINRQKKNGNILKINSKKFNFYVKCKEYEWYLSGIIFYINKGNYIIKKNNIDDRILDEIIKKCKFDPSLITNALEGHYICVIKRSNNIKVFGDKFNRKNLFYCECEEYIFFDTIITKEILSKTSHRINEMFLYSYFLIEYGNASTTIFKDIKRLAYCEYLLYQDDEVNIINTFNPKRIDNSYNEDKIQCFKKLFYESVNSRITENKNNWVMASGGWDSTLIIDTLLKHIEKQKVKMICWEIQLKSAQIFNTFEIKRVKNIAKHYGIDLHLIRLDLRSLESINKWKKFAANSFENQTLQFSIIYGIPEYIKSIDNSCGSIFSGECADSFQNYGFSQYISLKSNDYNFNEYADKMKTYLYGPTFLNKIINNTFKSDIVYNIFKKLNPQIQFSDINPDISKYFLSFIYSSVRLPFVMPKNLQIFKNHYCEKMIKYIISKYLQKYIERLAPENIYSIWNALYADFHLRGLAIPMTIQAMEKYNTIPSIPFYDLRIADFFERMPEKWGRNLNFKSIKYFEKRMALESKTFPINVLEDKSFPHSYINEQDNISIDLHYEFYLNSSITDYFRELLSNKKSLDYLGQIDGINYEYLENVRNNFVENRILKSDYNMTMKICALTSLMHEFLNN